MMNNLVFYRKRARMRQFDIARQLGVTEQLISKWECGRAEPCIEQAVDIARILGIDPIKVFPEMFRTSFASSGVDDGERPSIDNKGMIANWEEKI